MTERSLLLELELEVHEAQLLQLVLLVRELVQLVEQKRCQIQCRDLEQDLQVRESVRWIPS